MRSERVQSTGLRLKRLFAALLAAAMLPLASGCSVLRFASDSAGGLVINEVVSSNRRSLIDVSLGSPDWIELYNGGPRDLDLSGCGLSDNMRELHKYVFPAGTVIPAGGFLMVYATGNSGAEPSEALCAGFSLSKNGEYLILTDGYDKLLCQLELPALKTDISYARRESGGYGYCATPTPGTANTEQIAASLDALLGDAELHTLALSEVMPTADESGWAWAEVHNTGDTALSLENYCLSDSSRNLTRWQFPAAVIPAGGYAAVYLSGLGEEGVGLHTSFKLGRGENRLLLASLGGELLGELSWEEDIPKGVSVVAGEGVCYTAYPSFEAENATLLFTSLTVTEMTAEEPVRISEVQKTNRVSVIDGDGDRSEWVELHNFTNAPVSLRGYFLSDDALEPYKWALPDMELAAGGYLIVFLSGKDRSDPAGQLHASFGLSAEENALYLTRLDGMRRQEMPLEGLADYSISVGLDAEGLIRYFAQPTPGSANGRGFEIADMIGYFHTDGVYISEVSAAGEPRSGANDWIELYNGGAEPVALTGWSLSDDPAEPLKWRFPQQTIGAGEYLVVEASSHPARQTPEVAAFGVSTDGETLLLSDADGMPVDAFDTGALVAGLSSGRIEGDAGIARVFFERPTRGKRNDNEAFIGYTAQPLLSETGLYHTEPFTVSISCAEPGAQIYYTLDGSEPTARDTLYTAPVEITKNCVLRAAGFSTGKLPSQIATADYLFDAPHTIPVLCIDGEPAGIRTVLNTVMRNDKPERAAYASYFEADGTLGLRFPCGLRAKGAGTLAYAQKSLSLNLRASYGQTEIRYPLFTGYPVKTFSSLALRNGGQDWDEARMRDAFCQNLVEAEGLHLDNTPTRPVAVYLNGAYWGLYDLSEDPNSDYLETHYGVDGDAVDIIRRNATVLAGSGKELLRLREYALDTALKSDEKFNEYSGWLDVPYFTDYLIAETYMCNTDMFNQKYWRAQDYSLKWRPVFYDLDFGFSSLRHSTISHFFSQDGVPSANGTRTYFELYIGLKKNRAWREYCAERYVEVVMTYFNAERATALFDAMVREREDEMVRHIKRWGQPWSMDKWRAEVKSLRSIIEQRPAYALKSMATYFGLTDSELQTLVAKYTP